MSSRPISIELPAGRAGMLLVGMTGHEGLSTLGSFSLTLKSKQPDVAAQDLLGQNVTVRLLNGAGKPRYFNGYLTRWSGVTEIHDALPDGRSTKAYVYEATMSPWLWFLTRSANSRIFQNMTVPEVIADVLGKHGAVASYRSNLSLPYRKWEYCVQYRETDFNFISRLMEQEGIYYAIEHRNGSHTLVLADGTSALPPLDGYAQVRYDHEGKKGGEILDRLASTHEIQTGRYAVADYDFKSPRLAVDATKSKSKKHPFSNLEYFDYPAEVDDPGQAEIAAKVRLDEIHSNYHTFSAGGDVRGFQPGSSFLLQGHPVAAFNDKHLVVSASYHCSGNSDHSGAGSTFTFNCSINAIPQEQQFRPPRLTPKPLIQGPQTAVVVGRQGQEVDTDDFGRVKVQFRWDRYGKADEKSSIFIRVAQFWAGNGYGAIALPRIGHEVIVEFLEGDPDWPIITGSVYNGENRPPYTKKEMETRWGLKSRSTKGGGTGNLNEIRFEDKKGQEELFIQAERDLSFRTKRRRLEAIGEESHLEVKKDLLEKLDADRHLSLKGDDLTQVGGGVHLTIGQGWEAKVGTKLAAAAGKEIHLKAGANVVIEAATQISFKVGGNFVTINSGGVFIKGTQVAMNSGGSAGTGSGAAPKAPKNVEKPPVTQGGKDKPMTQKAATLKAARASATPFCEICQ